MVSGQWLAFARYGLRARKDGSLQDRHVPWQREAVALQWHAPYADSSSPSENLLALQHLHSQENANVKAVASFNHLCLSQQNVAIPVLVERQPRL